MKLSNLIIDVHKHGVFFKLQHENDSTKLNRSEVQLLIKSLEEWLSSGSKLTEADQLFNELFPQEQWNQAGTILLIHKLLQAEEDIHNMNKRLVELSSNIGDY